MRGVYNGFVFPTMEFLLCMFVRNHTACKVIQVYTAFPLVFKKRTSTFKHKKCIYMKLTLYVLLYLRC